MSVAQLSAREIATFAATAEALDLIRPDTTLPLCYAVTAGNVAAWVARYRDRIPEATAEDLRRELEIAREDEGHRIETHCGPIAYNLAATNEKHDKLIKLIEVIETQTTRWQEGKRREFKRAEENAVAFNEVGRLATLSEDEIATTCRAAKCERVIVARFVVDETDLQSDYFGGRQTCEVVIGFGKGKRENFKQLRKAAAKFEPTAEFGPGFDEFTVRVVHANTYLSNGRYVHEGDYAPTHSAMGSEREFIFSTREAAEAFIVEQGEPCDIHDGGEVGHYKWRIAHKSFEHRENWSMGGGNYLGRGRYTGWKVSSVSVDCYRGDARREVYGV